MTVTISRLYDSYAQATEAVSNLEKAGVPHSDISIVSNNSDNWYSENTCDVGLEPAPYRSSSRFPFRFTLA